VSTIQVQGRAIGEIELERIGQLMVANPQWSRYRLSVALAEEWQWRNGAGRLKDMAVRTLLLKLHRRGLIELPPPRCIRPPAQAFSQNQGELLGLAPDSIDGILGALQPLRLERIDTLAQRRWATQLLQQHHYRGYSGAVGENVQYLAKDRLGREVAVMIFGAAAWKVGARDQFIGWSVAQRQARLSCVVNQQRFLILPWVRVPHLASHLLALSLRRLSADWQHRYGHAVWLVETFVEEERFAGTSYKAAGWIRVGETTGRTRQDRQRTLQTPIKSVWVKPLHARFRAHLTLP
jgi:hypothetical protein